MNAFEGTIRNGQIILDVPASLPEGTRVEVTPISHSRPTLGMREEDWPTTAEGIAALLARTDQVEPGWLSPEDDATWRAVLRAQKETEKAEFSNEAEQLKRRIKSGQHNRVSSDDDFSAMPKLTVENWSTI